MELSERTMDVVCAGGFVNKYGKWNSVVMRDGKIFRNRVETIIVNHNGDIYMDIHNNKYRLPGGGVERDNDKMKQAIAECREEAFIVVNHMIDTGYEIIEYFDNTNFKPEGDAIIHDGKLTSLFIGRYKEAYHGYVPPVDRDNYMKENGKFYPFEEVRHMLKKEHIAAYEKYIYGDNSIEQNEKIFPYYTPEQMEELGVYNSDEEENYFGTKAAKDNSDWFNTYKETYDPGKEWFKLVKEAYITYIRDKSKANKQTLLELGWNPELNIMDMKTIKNISESTKSILRYNNHVVIRDVR